jgi:uncharacterized protein
VYFKVGFFIMTTKVLKKTIDEQEKAERAIAREKRKKDKLTRDSFQNFNLQLGMGTDNQLSHSTYGFNPITRFRILLEWIHRGSWLGGVAIDTAAEDMVRGGIEIHGSMKTKDVDKLQKAFIEKGVWDRLTFCNKMARLYGGAIGVLLIEGQDLSTPLDIETVSKTTPFQGIAVFDRWMCVPTLQEDGLVEEYGLNIGKPKYYIINRDTPYLRGKKIHYTRVIRMLGVEPPFYQSILEQNWGYSVLERLYDRLIAFDSATSGIAQYIHKMHLRVIKIDKFRQIQAAGGKLLQGFMRFAEDMRRRQSNEGVTFIDGNDDFVLHTSNVSSGISDALMQLGQQLAGALQMPLVRLFGQSPAGLNATGESDLRTYYEGILQKQEMTLRIPITLICHLIGRTIGLKLPDDFNFNFRSLWQLNDEQKSQVFDRDTRAVGEVFEVGIIGRKTALSSLKGIGRVSGRWQDITDKEIDEADDIPVPEIEFQREKFMVKEQAKSLAIGGNQNSPKPSGNANKDSFAYFMDQLSTRNNDIKIFGRKMFTARRALSVARDITPVIQLFGLPIVIECKKGERRWADGPEWPSDYGYICSHLGNDGDELDCFIGDNLTSNKVFVLNHYEEDGTFDELKVMLGFNSIEETRECYLKSYGRECGDVAMEIPLRDVYKWLAHADVTKPLRKRRARDKKPANGLDRDSAPMVN